MKSRALPAPRRAAIMPPSQLVHSVSFCQILSGLILNCLHKFFIISIFDILAKITTLPVPEIHKN